ncbi:putative transcription factor C16C4.22 [Astathelohania contejeani]|uniref:Transcription factor C16C4.22 n=1 Tax=Astathelohania contejeani TaxID=164912 RepID=A0ABQ7HZF0_9MICR|nr:putative transcription factor C16C4.22 [Thelohania contejeani]
MEESTKGGYNQQIKKDDSEDTNSIDLEQVRTYEKFNDKMNEREIIKNINTDEDANVKNDNGLGVMDEDKEKSPKNDLIYEDNILNRSKRSKNLEFGTILPFNKIKKILTEIEDGKSPTDSTVKKIALATELILTNLINDSVNQMESDKRKTLFVKDLESAIKEFDYFFLENSNDK